MNKDLLKKHINSYLKYIDDNQDEHSQHTKDRADRVIYYQSYTKNKIENMSEEDFYEFISKLWAMLIWGNKHYVVDKLINDNGFKTIKTELAKLIWGTESVKDRWDKFRSNIKGMGPAMMSELLSHIHPNKCMIWNRRAYAGFKY
jgi:hypothetical protein